MKKESFFSHPWPTTDPSHCTTAQQDATGAWEAAIAKAKALTSQMTVDEKVSLTSGVTTTTGCAGWIPGVARLGFPGLCLANAGNGVGATDYVTAFPSGLHAAASWNKALAYQRSYWIGREARTKGVNILLGPVVGPAGRVVEGGRNWEGWLPICAHVHTLLHTPETLT